MDIMKIILVFSVLLFTLAQAGRWSGLTTDNKKWYFALNNDVDLLRRTSVVMAIRGCKGADILFRQYVGKGQYVYVRLGIDNNAMSYIYASTLCGATGTCTKGDTDANPALDCKSFKVFWFKWDNWGQFTVGKGSKVGTGAFMDMNYDVDSNGDFKLRSLSAMSAYSTANVEYYYYIDNAPVMIKPSPFGYTQIGVPESAAINTNIQATSASDIDGDSLTFGLLGSEYADTFAWNKDTNQFYIKGPLDYEKKKVYYLKIGVSDGTRLSESSIAVIIKDVDDEDPTVAGVDSQLTEEILPGTNIWSLVSISDPDTNQEFTLSLSGDDASYFIIVSNNIIQVAKRLDRETKSSLSLTVTATDSGSNTGSVSLSLTLDDVNDNSPACANVVYYTSIDEGTTEENIKIMDAITCTDKDTGTSGEFVASITSGNTNTLFSLSGLELTGSPKLADYETMAGVNYRYYLTLLLKDKPPTGPVMSGNVFVVVEVKHANEFDPIWKTPSVTAGNFPDITIAEDKPYSEVIETYTAEDSDLGDDGKRYFEIVSIKTDGGTDASGTFMIGYKNGELRPSTNLDSDNGVSSYEIIVKVKDGGTTPRSIQATQKITLTGVNDNVPVFVSPSLEVSVSEATSSGGAVTTLDVSDGDGDTLTQTVSGGATTVFTTSGFKLVTAGALDFEAKKCYSAVVSSSDGTFTTPLGMTVRVTDVNDVAPDVQLNSDLSMFEGLDVGTVLYGLYTIVDPDKSNTFTYTLAV